MAQEAAVEPKPEPPSLSMLNVLYPIFESSKAIQFPIMPQPKMITSYDFVIHVLLP
jgi:hypothetical protein